MNRMKLNVVIMLPTVLCSALLGFAILTQTGCKGYGGDLGSSNQEAGKDTPLKPRSGTAADDD